LEPGRDDCAVVRIGFPPGGKLMVIYWFISNRFW